MNQSYLQRAMQRLACRPHDVKLHLAVLTAYAVLSIAVTWPLLAHLHSGIVGEARAYYEDASQFVWNMWWGRRALEHLQNPFWSPMLYYPDGVQMYLQTLSITNVVITLPVQYLAGPVAAYNTAVLVAFTLTGYNVFLLVRAFVPRIVIPFLCGALITAAPFHVLRLEVAQLNLVSAQWLPLYFLALLRLDHRRDIRAACWAVLALLLVALTDWYWLLICAIYTGLWFVISLTRASAHHRMRLVQSYLWFGCGTVIALAPLVLGLYWVRHQLPAMNTGQDQMRLAYIEGFSSDALGVFFPSIFQPLWAVPARALVTATATGTFALEGYYVAAGWVLLTLAMLGVAWCWRTHGYLLLVVMAMWLLAIGPKLRVGGYDTGLMMPYALLQHMPLLGTARRPSLFAVPGIMLAAVFMGLALQRLQLRLAPRWFTTVLSLVCGLSIIELWPPSRILLTFPQSALFQRLRERPGAVADLPLEWMETSRSLRHQMIHEQPVLGGYVARRPPYPALDVVPLLNQLVTMQYQPDIVPLAHADLAAMQCYAPVRHVVVDRSMITVEQQQALEQVLATLRGSRISPLLVNADVIWYELPLFPNQCKPFVSLGAGWHPQEASGQQRWRWTTEQSSIQVINPFTKPVATSIQITAIAPDPQRAVELWYDQRRLATLGVSDNIRQYTVLVDLVPGVNQLQLRSTTSPDPGINRTIGIQVTDITIGRYTALNSAVPATPGSR